MSSRRLENVQKRATKLLKKKKINNIIHTHFHYENEIEFFYIKSLRPF